MRGSTHVFSPTELAIWVRNPEGGILAAIEQNPAVSLLFGYFEPDDRGFLNFRGRARRDDSAAVREKVYGNAHEFERSQDAERKGVAVGVVGGLFVYAAIVDNKTGDFVVVE